MIIGIDVGGTNTSGGLASEDGKLAAKAQRRTDRAAGGAGGIELISEIVSELTERAGGRGTVSRIGIGFGGPVDFKRGVVLLSHHVPGWEGVRLRDILQERFDTPVVVDNDANAGTLGEWKFGAGRGCGDLLYVNIGTGIGGGVIAGGRPVRGAQNLAGEIGHTVVVRDGPPCSCGKRGCLEACACGEAIGRRGTEALGRAVSGRDVFELAGDGNPTALRVLDQVIEDLGHGIGTAVSLLNPAMVIIGGGLSEAPPPLFLEPLRRAVPRYSLPEAAADLRIETAQLRYDAGIMGAVALALLDS